jgi:hypothetical protein
LWTSISNWPVFRWCLAPITRLKKAAAEPVHPSCPPVKFAAFSRACNWSKTPPVFRLASSFLPASGEGLPIPLKDVGKKTVVAKIILDPNGPSAQVLRALQPGDEVLLASDANIDVDDDYDSDNMRTFIVTTSKQPVAWFGGEFGDRISRDLDDGENCFRAFVVAPTTAQKQGTIRIQVIGGNGATEADVAAWLRGERAPKEKPAKTRMADKSAQTGRSYNAQELSEVYRAYARLKGWNATDQVVRDKVEAWLGQTIGPVGLALQWHETGTDPKPELTRSRGVNPREKPKRPWWKLWG